MRRSPQELINHLDSLIRNQVYTGANPALVPLHVETVREIVETLRAVSYPPQVEKALKGELPSKEHND